MSAHPASRSWHREPWLWFLMSGPIVVVVAAIATAVIAVRTSDVLVSNDYYREGLAFSHAMGKEEMAPREGPGALLRVDVTGGRVQAILRPADPPAFLRLTLHDATHTGGGEVVVLASKGGGLYEGALPVSSQAPWQVDLDDDRGRMHLSGTWPRSAAELRLGELGR